MPINMYIHAHISSRTKSALLQPYMEQRLSEGFLVLVRYI